MNCINRASYIAMPACSIVVPQLTYASVLLRAGKMGIEIATTDLTTERIIQNKNQ